MFDKIKIVAGLMAIVSLSQCSIAYAGDFNNAIDELNGFAFPKEIAQIDQAANSNTEPKQEKKKNYVGFTVGSIILNIPAYGINAKFEVADNISVRPFIQFAKLPRVIRESVRSNTSGGDINASGALYGVSATYDFNIPKSEVAPYAGIGLVSASGNVSYTGANKNSGSGSGSASPLFIEIGADYNFTENVVINANYKFSPQEDFGLLSFGAGYRF
jgi:opacity protein-like surface antigen